MGDGDESGEKNLEVLPSVEQFKTEVLERVRAAGVSSRDPLFEILVNTNKLELLLEVFPKALDNVFLSWRKTLRADLDAYGEAAVRGQQRAIARSVEELVEESRQPGGGTKKQSVPWGWVGLGIGLGLVVGIVLSGYLLPILQGKIAPSAAKLQNILLMKEVIQREK